LNGLFVNMAFASPRPGKEEVLAESMRSFAKALEVMPGLLQTFVLSEEGGKTLVGISMWQDKDAFEKAMESVRPPPPPEPVEQMRMVPPVVRQFETI
jgi:heme-degrading monooxygenase HmoA